MSFGWKLLLELPLELNGRRKAVVLAEPRSWGHQQALGPQRELPSRRWDLRERFVCRNHGETHPLQEYCPERAGEKFTVFLPSHHPTSGPDFLLVKFKWKWMAREPVQCGLLGLVTVIQHRARTGKDGF